MMGIILITGVTVLLNIIAGVAYAVADPRVRYNMGKS
jgi:ABC-type dipeptide/oligopeptide/nickel transport system permease component